MNKGYKIDSELSESQIEADVASYLGYITPFWSNRFQLIAIDEQLSGADKLFNRFVPLYLQFKVSEGLKPLKFNFHLTSPNRPLQKIRKFRRDNSLSDNPILYFKLRDLAKNAKDFQHNILKSMHDPPKQYGLYVAPLSLTSEDYNESLNSSLLRRLFLIDPFFHKELRYYHNSFRQEFKILPFLRGHISISPHEKVQSSNHYYAYSKLGSDVSWHSGSIMDGDFRLSYKISQIYEQFYDNLEMGYSSNEYQNFINEFMGSNDYNVSSFSSYLKENFNIRLLFLGHTYE
ncbi:hypothetical protein [Rhodohalobacter sp. 614A]|uniref:hypothetical protein n=1 Tax=Rhodohalobacter sp. 614A TaxID=2908649 RepID=UPI001F341D9C|nr:hypothetical protein [Rhodohalobacter sp. 614A]